MKTEYRTEQRKTRTGRANGQPMAPQDVFDDPVAYLAGLGIEAEMVAVFEATVPRAA